MREKGIARVAEIMGDMNLDACILRGMDNIFYLTGFRGSEGALVVTRGDVILLTDSRYITHAMEATKDVKIVELQPRTNTLSGICEKYAIHSMGFDGVHTTYDVYARWKEHLTGVEMTPLPAAIEAIRAVKEPEEIEAIKKAVRCATDAFNETFERIRPGITEKEIARDLDYAMERHGADSPSFATIVASGPRTALPHAEPTDKRLREGEAVIIDFGAQVEGYCSDETCTLSVGEPNDKIHEILSIVKDALDLGLKSIKAGMPAGDLDMIVRGFIGERGYGEYFGHGLGHGVGVAVHEAPTVSTQSGGLLEANMIFTVEPGIYVPHLGGVRLEDMVLLEEDRTTILTHIRKDMLKIKV
jgi:Xaa-Pro aminopeptidase